MQTESPWCGTKRFGMCFIDTNGRMAAVGSTLEIMVRGEQMGPRPLPDGALALPVGRTLEIMVRGRQGYHHRHCARGATSRKCVPCCETVLCAGVGDASICLCPICVLLGALNALGPP